MWAQLSQDEPENQVPPANLEQLIAMLTREMARRIVHFTNYAVNKAAGISQLSMHFAHVMIINVIFFVDYFLQVLFPT